MKKVLLTLFLAGIFSFSNVNAEEKIRIATGEYEPFLSENLKHNGVGLRIIREAFALEGIKVEYGFFPWKRSYNFAKYGDWDATATWANKAGRDKDFYFSDPLYQSASVFFHLKTYKFDWNTLDDLKGISIGATDGYTYPPKFFQAIKNQSLNVDFDSSPVLNYKKLLKGRIEIFPNNIDVGYATLASKFTQQELESVTHHPRFFTNNPTYLIFSKKIKKNIRMRDLFNKGLKRLKNSGKFDQYFMESRRGDYIIKKSKKRD